MCEILLPSRFIAKHFLITKTGAKRTDEFVKVSFIYSYFENGCRKKCARDNPERLHGICSIHCSWHCSCRTYFCCFPLALADICPWPLLPFFQISLKNSALKTTHNTFRGCRVHFIRRPFLKQLYISVGNCRAHYRHIFMHKDNLSTTSLHCVRAGCELRQ